MDLISQHKVFHGGTYNTNPVSMAAGLATFRSVLTRENYAHVDKLSKKLTDGYREIVAKVGLQGYIISAGANGALMLYPKEIRNYRDWLSDRRGSVAALLVWHGEPRRDGAALLVGRAVDDLGSAHRSRHRQTHCGLRRCCCRRWQRRSRSVRQGRLLPRTKDCVWGGVASSARFSTRPHGVASWHEIQAPTTSRI